MFQRIGDASFFCPLNPGGEKPANQSNNQYQQSNQERTKPMKTATLLLAMSLGATSLMAQRPLGIDVSAAQGSINWSTVAANGVKFAFTKASEGTYYVDPNYAANMSGGKTAGVLMGAYHFARPDIDTPLQEANYFWNHAGGRIKADGKTVMPMIDFETFAGHDGATSYTQWFNNWSSDVIADGQGALVTLRPVVFCSPGNGACDLTTSITLGAFIGNPNGQNMNTGTPWSCCTSCNAWDPNGTGGWTFWDFGSGTIGGISGTVGFDTYNGTLTNLKANEVVTVY
jgi:lysozyme